MRRIYKYALSQHGVTKLHLPRPTWSKILCVHLQGGLPHLWAEVTLKAPVVPRTFLTFFTGQELPENLRLGYLGTMIGNPLVFHVYEVEPSLDETLAEILNEHPPAIDERAMQ